MDQRLVFMGSPAFALPTLAGLISNYDVVGVVTQPDRKSGRGRKLTPPPVKSLAVESGIPVIQPAKLRTTEAMEALEAWQPTLIVVAAYGQILRPAVLGLPQFGCINVHASLLPRWRGASPVHHAILSGDMETGVTIMKMDEGLDTGPMISKSSTLIRSNETTLMLSERLAQIGADLLVDTLPKYIRGEILPVVQDDAEATYAPMLKKQDGLLDFRKNAEELERQVRAFIPWPGAYFESKRGLIKVHMAKAVDIFCEPGKPAVFEDFPAVGTANGLLVLEKLQPAGKSMMDGDVYLQGAQDWAS